MSTAAKPLGVLTTTVHILDPIEHVPLVLTTGAEITDPAIAEQITNPKCWLSQLSSAAAATTKTTRKSKAA
ncbi:hypothetical protein [Streptomyces noursei]|uniref:hypothetical protein n=1 Tax=Streptomyces noursei TaxID=1971 RepID=UPI0016768807|nr:hypothetical protein [Streptomyces noursei]MCZ1019798.1 hypothetical protein [Streptomyces noursei]GGX36559.1 hypothetical protein GCM10010341_67690 [Streptomyces noursei]